MNESTIADIKPHPKSTAHNMINSFAQGSAASTKTSSIGFLLTATLIISGMIFSLNLHAAEEIETEDTSPSWYEIELVIFSRVNPDPSHNEYWNQYLKLSFPSKLGVLDTNFSPSKLRYVEVEEKEEEKPNANKENAASKKLVPVYPPYTNLEIKSTRLLYAENRLKQNGQFKILSHTRWVQPLTEKESSIPLLFQAGNIYNDLYELEGTILVSVSRYIHIDSNLWLSSFTENQTLLDTWWSEADEEQTLVPAFNQSQFTKSNQCSKNFNLINTQNVKEDARQEQSIDYIITQIAQMKQSRRMRSNEVHYLDHPLFGIIVTTKPYSLPVESIPDDSPILPKGTPKSISPLTEP